MLRSTWLNSFQQWKIEGSKAESIVLKGCSLLRRYNQIVILLAPLY